MIFGMRSKEYSSRVRRRLKLFSWPAWEEGGKDMLMSETGVKGDDELTDSEKELLDLIISHIIKQILPWLQ